MSAEGIAESAYQQAIADGAPPSVAMRLKSDIQEVLDAHRKRLQKAVDDRRAAELLPLGPDVAAARLRKSRRAIYKMVRRHRERMKKVHENSGNVHSQPI